MDDLNISFSDYFHKWKSHNLSEEVIINELNQLGIESLQIIEILSAYKRKCNDEKQYTGFTILAIGAFIGFLSCVFTMLDFSPDLRGFMLYGLTSIALVLIFIGLYFVFE